MRWISNTDSVENNEPTILAIFETLVAVVAYWGIAWWLDTHIHLLISICVAPLLLLRSPESTDRGVRWFLAYMNGITEITPENTPGRFWGIVLFALVISAACAYGLAHVFLVGHEGWALFARAFGVGVLTGIIGVMAAVAVAVAVVGAGTGAVAVAVVGAVAVAAAGAGAIAGAGAVAGAVAVAVGIAPVFVVLFFFVSFAAGVWLRSLGVRVVATLRHPVRGIRAVPNNWRRILLAMDSHHAPELVPGLSAHEEELSLPGMIKEIRTGDWEIRLIGSLMIPIFFLPGLLYRWSLKSTCWLYLPLIYLGGGLGRSLDSAREPSLGFAREPSSDAKEKGLLVAGLHKSRWESSRRWLMLLVVGSAVVTTAINHPAFGTVMREFLASVPKFLGFLPPVFALLTEHAADLAYLWAFDFNGPNLAPWQWLNILGAVITGLIFFYSDRVDRVWRLAKEQDSAAAPESTQVWVLLGMARVRNLCAVLYVLLAFGYVVLALGGVDAAGFAGWLAPVDALYGPYL